MASDQGKYVQTSGITGVLVNNRVGQLLVGAEDSRGRYDTLGRTVYFADTPKTALAEVLQHLRVQVMALTKDAEAIGLGVDEYRGRLTEEAHARGVAAPGEVSVDWQMTRSLYEVALSTTGWWVVIDCPATLNALSDRLGGSAGQLTLADVCGNNGR